MKTYLNPRTPTGADGVITAGRKQQNKLLLRGLLVSAWLAAVMSGGAATSMWTGAGGDDNWSTPGNWQGDPLAADSNVIFTNLDAAVPPQVNNVVDSSRTVSTLWYIQTNITHITEIPAGVSLTVTGAVLGPTGNPYALLAGTTVLNSGDSAWTAIRGEGALVINSPGGWLNVRVGKSSTSGTPGSSLLNLSELNTLTATVSRLSVGGEGANVNNRPAGVLYLAKTNLVVSTDLSFPALVVSDSGSDPNGQTNSVLYLGHTNAFLLDSGVAFGRRRSRAAVKFWSTSNPVAFFRDSTGAGRQNEWAVADNVTAGNSAQAIATADFSGGTLDAKVNTLYVARGQTSSTTSANGQATGTLILGAGCLDVNTAEIGYQRPTGSAAIGKVITSGGPTVTNLVVNGNLRLGNYDGLSTASQTIGTLNINSAVVVKGDILSGGSALNVLTLTNGHLLAGGIGNDNGSADTPLPNVILDSGTLTLDLGMAGNPLAPVCNISDLTIGAITLNTTGAGLSAGTIPLIKVYGTLGGNGFAGITFGSLPPKVVGSFSNSADTVYLVIQGVNSPVWNGDQNGDWDIATTANWRASFSGAATTYDETTVPGDSVLFDDSATGTTTVTLTTNLSPSAIIVDNTAKTYTFTGSGRLSGPTGLAKTGSGSLTLANAGVNDFSGTVLLNGGTVRLDGTHDRLPAAAAVILADAAGVSLDLNGFNQQLGSLDGGGSAGGQITLGSGTLTMSGAGSTYAGVISGTGVLVKTNAGTQTLSGANTYQGGTVVHDGTLIVANTSGSGLGSGGLQIAGGALQIGLGGTEGAFSQSVITNHGILALNRGDDLTFSKLLTGSGGLLKLGSNTVSIATANSHTGANTINEGALRISHPQALGAADNFLAIANARPAQLELMNNLTLNNPIEIASKSATANYFPPAILNVADTNTVAGLMFGISGGSDFTFQSDAGKLVVAGLFTNQITGTAKRIRLRGAALGEWQSPIQDGEGSVLRVAKLDSGTWVLASGTEHTYSSDTTIEQGTLVVNGSILGSVGVLVNNSAGVPAVLAGDGYIACPVTNALYGVLAPGESIGTLTISNRLELQQYSSCEFEVSASGYDQVRGMSEVVFGGTLNVTVTGNLTGTEVFKLFDAGAYSGGFGAVYLPSLPAPLDWDQSQLNTAGILRVTGGSQIGSVSRLPNGDVVLVGTGAPSTTYRVLAATNVALPIGSWTEVGTTTTLGDGTYSFTDTAAGSYNQRFYRLVTP